MKRIFGIDENKKQKVITFEQSALRKICEIMNVPYDPNIIAFTKKGVITNIFDLLDLFKDERPKEKKGKWVEHIVQEGARFHVVSYDSQGAFCSEPNCEINRFRKKTRR